METSDASSQEEVSTEKDESQKLPAPTVDNYTAPHCEHVFVTDEFCAADASTPVRREHSGEYHAPEMSSTQKKDIVAKETAGLQK